MISWVSEETRLPLIGQKVLLLTPRQLGEFWDLKVSQLVVRYEGVVPKAVLKGTRWSADYWWDASRNGQDTTLVTGNSWWALYHDLQLPPGAFHAVNRGYHYIEQPEPIWVGQGE